MNSPASPLKATPKAADAPSAWSPLQHPFFRSLWLASVASNIGTWMHDTGAAWLMTSLAPSPLLVALMQTASSLPLFLLALPAGAPADIIDRRKFLMAAQAWMVVVATVLGVATMLGATTPLVLLGATFALGLGTAMSGPAWQATIPELVDRKELSAAVALTSVSFNIARAIGPALGGFIVAAAGSGAVFLLNAASFLGVLAILWRWRRQPRESQFPPEHILGAMRAGMRYVRYASTLHAVLIRSGLFMLCGSALWALLPLVARRELGLNAIGYGVLLGCIGVGAITGAMVLPRIQQTLSRERIVAGATLLFAIASTLLGFIRSFSVLCIVMTSAGLAWMALMSSFNVAAQSAVPAWVRARALAMFMLVSQGGMGIGSAIWGTVATHLSITTALVLAAGGLVLGLAAKAAFQLSSEMIDMSPSRHWPEPHLTSIPRPDDGPILITIEYRVKPEDTQAFAEAMQELSFVRRRDGAIYWYLFRDGVDPMRHLEIFIAESWAEHMRQHERFSVADRAIEQRARVFHAEDTPLVVAHLISAYAESHGPQ